MAQSAIQNYATPVPKGINTVNGIDILWQRVEIVYITEFKYCLPQGDPDEGNGPRQDPLTQYGYITDAGYKRLVRDFVALLGYELYVARRSVLSRTVQDALTAVLGEAELDTKTASDEPEEGDELDGAAKQNGNAKKKLPYEDALKVRDELCRRYWDMRAFGGVLCDPVNIGIRGPLQFGMGVSVDPITPIPIALTRSAVAKEQDAEKQAGRNQTMGNRTVVPYTPYREHIFYNPHDALATGFSKQDFDLAIRALQEMYDHANSSGRNGVVPRRIVIFKHRSALGNAPSHKLFERVKLAKKPGVDSPTCWDDYIFDVDQENLPDGVEVDIID